MNGFILDKQAVSKPSDGFENFEAFDEASFNSIRKWQASLTVLKGWLRFKLKLLFFRDQTNVDSAVNKT